MTSARALILAAVAFVGGAAGVRAQAPASQPAGSPWDAIAARAAAAPAGRYSPERATLEARDRYKAYYETFKDWKAPAPLAPAAAKLANLPEEKPAPRFQLTDKVWPAKAGEASICLWEDDKTAAYSFSIDDNNAADIPFWTELSKKYGDLKITWFLITINIGGTFDRGRVGSAGTWEAWQKVVAADDHVGSHSVTHVSNPVASDGWPGPAWEAVQSRDALDARLTGRKTKVFAYPGSPLKEFNNSATWRPEIPKYYAAARGGSGIPVNVANQIDYFNIRTTTNVENSIRPTEPRLAAFDITNILNPDLKGDLKKYYRGWATTFIHSVNGGRDWGQTPSSKAHIAVFEWVAAYRDELWVGALGDVALYAQTRDTGAVETKEASDGRIVLALTSRMDPAIFDYPLTVKVRLPSAWNGRASATQGDRTAEAKVIAHEGAHFALVRALPDRGDVVLTPGQ